MSSLLSIHNITLDKLGNGNLPELFHEQFMLIKNNIKDERCWIDAPRKLVIEVTIKPRTVEEAYILTKVKSYLAPVGCKPQLVDLTSQQLLERIK